MRAVHHSPLRVVANDRGAAQPLEDADLDLLRIQCNESVETCSEARYVFTWQSNDQVRVHMHTRFLAQEAEVLCEPGVVLPAADALRHLLVERLDSHLELQRARRKSPDRVAQGVGQPIGKHLEVQEQSRPVSFEKQLKDRASDVEIQVERAIDELELLYAAIE